MKQGKPPISRAPLWLRLARIARLALHLAEGLAKTGIVFPRWSDARRREEIRRWSRRLLALLSIRLEAPHPPEVPEGGAMFVLNHVSWLDIFVLDALLPVTFVAKAEIGRWPLVGTLVTRSGTLYIERGSKSAARRTNERIAAVLREGRPVGLFPEGTTTWGESVNRFHSALLQPAIESGAALYPVALCYFGADGQPTRAAAYVGDDSLARSIWMIVSERRLSVRLEVLDPIPAAGQDRRALAELSRDGIAIRLEQVRAVDSGGPPGSR